MNAIYKIDIAGQERLVSHPKGLPPSWTVTNTTNVEQEAIIKAMKFLNRWKIHHFSPDFVHIAEFDIV